MNIRTIALRSLLLVVTLVLVVGCDRSEAVDAPPLTWRRVGGIAGFCDGMIVQPDREVLLTNCEADLQAPEADIEAPVETTTLTDGQANQLETYLERYAAFAYSQTDEAEADAMTIEVVFGGIGDELASDAVQAEIAQFAGEIYTRLSQ